MLQLQYIIWNADPVIFTIPLSSMGWEDRPIVWYGLLFALGFLISQQILYWFFGREGKPLRDVDTLTLHMILATVIGSRLGHCLFYAPEYYLSNPLEILKVWEGGLASHGGALGILTSLWIYANYKISVNWIFGLVPFITNIKKEKRAGQSYLWTLDRIVIVVALTGAMIRFGNLMNSEMEGTKTNSDYGLVYAKNITKYFKTNSKIEEVSYEKNTEKTPVEAGMVPIKVILTYKGGQAFDQEEKILLENRIKPVLLSYESIVKHIDFNNGMENIDYVLQKKEGKDVIILNATGIVRHPAQIYESIYCIFIMLILLWIYVKKKDSLPEGFIFALFMIILWTLRFFDEYFKLNQEAFEDNLPFNMGQLLSVPFVLTGFILIVYVYRKKKNEK